MRIATPYLLLPVRGVLPLSDDVAAGVFFCIASWSFVSSRNILFLLDKK
jgi:hypothetical protein